MTTSNSFPSPTRRGAPSRKAAGRLPTASRLGADFLTLCDLDPEIVAVSRGDVTLEFTGGIGHQPAYRLVLEGGASILADVVPDASALPAPTQAIADAAAAAGHGYRLETAATLRAEPRFTTMRLIASCRRVRVGAGDRVRILAALDEAGTLPLIEAASAARGAVDGVAAVLALACEGLVAVDLDAPLGPETPVRRVSRICAIAGAVRAPSAITTDRRDLLPTG
ncbi:hypothetical protein ACTZWW_08485 [Salinarimonas sp. NSM]|uniref:hypothetical protein n=1 Tax=Salinarimonas sp. NSM TaxID=3458003 RepID=UPI00403648D0